MTFLTIIAEVPRFGEAVFGEAEFAKEIAFGTGEIGLGFLLLLGGLFFIRKGKDRIQRAIEKRRLNASNSAETGL